MLIQFLRRRVPEMRPVDADAPRGIAGWLLLPMLHTCVLPIAVGMSLYGYVEYLDARTWNAIGEGASDTVIQLLKLAYFTLIVSGVALQLASLYTIFLFFARRRTYPFAWILVMWSWLAWLALDMTVVLGLPGEHQVASAQAGGNVGRIFLFCLIWTSYITRSRRVAATFVRDGSKPAPAPVVPAPVPTQTAG
jgi:hypothetical protein